MVSNDEEAEFELAGSEFSFDIDSLVPWLVEAERLWRDSHPDFLLLTTKSSVIIAASGFEAFIKRIVALRDKSGRFTRSRVSDYNKARGQLYATWEIDLDKVLNRQQQSDLKFLLCYRH